MSDLIIVNCDVLQLQGDAKTPKVSILREQDILIKGNRIEAVQAAGQADASHFKKVIHANSQLAMPGLINTHAHVPMVIMRGLAEDVNIERWFNDFIWQLESNLQAEDVYWGMMLGMAEMIENGVTSVADHYFHMDRVAAAVEKAGTRGLLGWAMFGSQGHEMIDQTAAWARETNGAAHGRIKTLLAPHAPYTCDDDFLRATAKKARELGLGVHIHVAETIQQTESSLKQHGLTPVQVTEKTGILANDLPAIFAHVCGATPADMELMAKYPVGVAHAPKTYLKLAMDGAPIVEFRRAGVPVGLATDGACSNNTLDIWESMRLLGMIQKSRTNDAENMTIPEVLYVATKESAKVFNAADSLGSIEAGYLADLILVDLQGMHHQPLHSVSASLVYNARSSDVQTTICDGQVLMENRTLLTLDKSEIIAQVRASMERVSQRTPSKQIQVYNL